ncbi:hypothetical protein [Bradyrhizobium campsiandrae]|nr:hypothetical protein [Bradyrhizobium campsiandrae]
MVVKSGTLEQGGQNDHLGPRRNGAPVVDTIIFFAQLVAAI